MGTGREALGTGRDGTRVGRVTGGAGTARKGPGNRMESGREISWSGRNDVLLLFRDIQGFCLTGVHVIRLLPDNPQTTFPPFL